MAEGVLRALDVRRDLDALVDLAEIAFTDALARRGNDLRAELCTARRLLPVLGVLGRVWGEMRHIFDGFVWEQDGRIVGTVIVQKMGNDPTRWLVGTVATHPDYRRRGIARRLVGRALAHARGHGAQTCVLDVEVDNEPACQLYRGLGFVRYDSTTRLKLETMPRVPAQAAEGYKLHSMKRSEWSRRYDLARRATPAAVQAFLPVSEAEYRVTRLGRLITPLLLSVQRLADHWWAAEKDGQLAGWVRLLASRVEKRAHELTLLLGPAHRGALAGPLLSLALETLQQYPPGVTTLSVRASEEDLLDLLGSYGFCAVETTHRLGIRLDDAPDQDQED